MWPSTFIGRLALEPRAVEKTDCPGENVQPTPITGLPHCELLGNSDFYGLGVRLGIYFSWLTSWIANNFLPSEMSGSFDTNSIFLSAIGLVGLYYSAKYDINIIDALILLTLACGFMFSVMSIWGYRTMYYKKEGPNGKSHFGGWGTHFRLGLCTGIAVYGLWFWTRGLSGGLPHDCNMREECGGLKIWLFGEFSLFSGVRHFYMVASILLCIYYGTMVLAATAAFVHHLSDWIRTRQFSAWNLQQLSTEDDGLDRRELTISYAVLSTINLLWMLFAGLTVELTLNFNHVIGVIGGAGLYGAGQLLPMFIGLFGFVRICWLLLREYYLEPRKEQKEVLGKANKLSMRHGRFGLGLRKLVHDTPDADPATTNTFQPNTGRVSTGGGPSRNQPKKALAHRIITAWLPWLTVFDWWHVRGAVHNNADFQLLSTSADLRMPTPYTGAGMEDTPAMWAPAAQTYGFTRGRADAEGDDREPLRPRHQY